MFGFGLVRKSRLDLLIREQAEHPREIEALEADRDEWASLADERLRTVRYMADECRDAEARADRLAAEADDLTGRLVQARHQIETRDRDIAARDAEILGLRMELLDALRDRRDLIRHAI